MTHIEKAKELVDTFTEPTQQWDEIEGKWEDRIELAKQCALIAVDEILLLLGTLNKPEYVAFISDDIYTIEETEYDTHVHGYELTQYFESVKEEINKL